MDDQNAGDDWDSFWGNVESAQKEEPEHKPYVSKDGFDQVNIYRGLFEVEYLLDVIGSQGLICGGYARWACSPTQTPIPASDVDVYGYNDASIDNLKHTFKEMGLSIVHENNISISYKRPEEPEHPFFACPTIQLIKPVVEGKVVSVGTVEDVLGNFDFTIVRVALMQNGDKHTAIADADYIHDETKRILRIKNIHCPVSSTLRCMKYSRKGYFLPPTQVLNILYDWDNRSDTYKTRLIEFLFMANDGEGLTKKQVEELESMMRID